MTKEEAERRLMDHTTDSLVEYKGYLWQITNVLDRAVVIERNTPRDDGRFQTSIVTVLLEELT